MTAKRFRVALSFPGEHRAYVSPVAVILREKLGQEAVFYDQWYTAELARPNMDTYLQAIYHDHAELIVPFLCADYERKQWCGLEWRAIRDLLKQRQEDDIMPLRFDSTHIPGVFSIDGYIDLTQHTPEQIAAFILQRLHINNNGIPCRSDFSPTTTPSSTPTGKDVGLKSDLQPSAPHIHSDRLPTVKGEFFGREAELQLLNDAWAGNDTRIIQFIAPGGTGKTKLLRHWLDHTDGIDALLAWSFYSQGASEDKQVSATPFFSHVFEKLGSTREKFATEEDKGEHLADLLRAQRCVLVLDGLEPLQHAGRGMQGELKDRAIRQLLKSLAGHSNGLCIVTTRIAVHELCDRTHVISHDLQNLAPKDGVLLLQSLGVKGSAAELQKAVQEYGCHALALSLLGNVLRLRYQGDVLKRDTLKALPVKAKGSKESRHAFKVMQAYAEWFAGEPELALLHLLGLFDHPIEREVLQVLWKAQIPHLTAEIDEEEWLEAVDALREEHHLLAQHEGGNDLDCHPLIREYFGQQLKEQQPDAWQQAHETLYRYYKALPEKELPDTLAEMQPLFSAVAHGCAAGFSKQAIQIYLHRIQRNKDNYLIKSLGAFNDDIEILAHFFDKPWEKHSQYWHSTDLPVLYNWVGFSLRAVGRNKEAIAAIRLSIKYAAEAKNWSIFASSCNTSSEILAIDGSLACAEYFAGEAVKKADCHLNELEKLGYRSTHGYILFLLGRNEDATAKFDEAEKIQQNWQPKLPILYSEQGFRYFEFLVRNSGGEATDQRAQYLLKLAERSSASQLEKALARLAVAKSLKILVEFDTAITQLRLSGQQQYLVFSLLARAALHRHTRDFARARQDLQEVFEIAEPSGMRLFLVDWHLEMARVLVAEAGFDFAQPSDLAPNHGFDYAQPARGTPRCLSVVEGNRKQAQTHIKAAANLIAATGYHRRDAELAELQGLTR